MCHRRFPLSTRLRRDMQSVGEDLGYARFLGVPCAAQFSELRRHHQGHHLATKAVTCLTLDSHSQFGAFQPWTAQPKSTLKEFTLGVRARSWSVSQASIHSNQSFPHYWIREEYHRITKITCLSKFDKHDPSRRISHKLMTVLTYEGATSFNGALLLCAT